VKIEVTRSGGFAGLTIRVAVDSDDLPDARRVALEGMLARTRFFQLPERVASGQPDAFLYHVVVHQDDVRYSVRIDDRAAGEDLRELLRWLMEVGRRA
jgi:hypothetical protein